jgi:hypothetical protein
MVTDFAALGERPQSVPLVVVRCRLASSEVAVVRPRTCALCTFLLCNRLENSRLRDLLHLEKLFINRQARPVAQGDPVGELQRRLPLTAVCLFS